MKNESFEISGNSAKTFILKWSDIENHHYITKNTFLRAKTTHFSKKICRKWPYFFRKSHFGIKILVL